MTAEPEDEEMIETDAGTLAAVAVVPAAVPAAESPLSASEVDSQPGNLVISPSGETLTPSAPFLSFLTFNENADGQLMGRIPEDHPLNDPHSLCSGGPARFFPLFLLTFALSSLPL